MLSLVRFPSEDLNIEPKLLILNFFILMVAVNVLVSVINVINSKVFFDLIHSFIILKATY